MPTHPPPPTPTRIQTPPPSNATLAASQMSGTSFIKPLPLASNYAKMTGMPEQHFLMCDYCRMSRQSPSIISVETPALSVSIMLKCMFVFCKMFPITDWPSLSVFSLCPFSVVICQSSGIIASIGISAYQRDNGRTTLSCHVTLSVSSWTDWEYTTGSDLFCA